MQKMFTTDLFTAYERHQRFTLHKKLAELSKRRSEIVPFAFVVSSVYSSLIEGSSIDIEKYLSYKQTGNSSSDLTQVQDLIDAYKFAKTHSLNASNLLKVHGILSRHFDIDRKYKGAIRDKEISVGTFFVTVYRGASKQIVKQEFDRMMAEVSGLKRRKKLTYNQIFYYAAYFHLLILKIHPFADGNGRLSRLAEKWFLASMLGPDAWLIPSEVFYQQIKTSYYDCLQRLGPAYDNLNMDRALDFLLLLPASFTISRKRYMLAR